MSAASRVPRAELKQFLVIMRDFKDPNALQRRLNVRNDHMKSIKELYQMDKVVCAGAILDHHESGNKMEGSAIVYQAESEAALRSMIDNDPYIKGKVWDKCEILPIRLATFEDNNKGV